MLGVVSYLARYGLVGIGVTLVYLGAASALKLLGTGVVMASVLAFAASNSLSYLAHRSFTFRSSVEHRSAVPRFLVISVTGFLMAAGIPAALERYASVSPYFSFLVVTVSVAAFSFLALKFAVFRPTQVPDAERDLPD